MSPTKESGLRWNLHGPNLMLKIQCSTYTLMLYVSIRQMICKYRNFW